MKRKTDSSAVRLVYGSDGAHRCDGRVAYNTLPMAAPLTQLYRLGGGDLLKATQSSKWTRECYILLLEDLTDSCIVFLQGRMSLRTGQQR